MTVTDIASAAPILSPKSYSLACAVLQEDAEKPSNIGGGCFTAGTAPRSKEDILESRQRILAPNMALFFSDDPLHIVRGRGCEIFDAEGHAYLDCINNVAHVGHCHPRVAVAVSQQLMTLNTNSRYLHEGLVTLAERLSQTMPQSLKSFFPVVSGSEANDLAWRIACAAAGPSAEPLHVAVVDHGYHGHTSATISISPYKFYGTGGEGRPLHVHVLPCPDVYRGKNLDGRASAKAAVAAACAAGGRIAAFFCESVISCGGQVVLPPGWLEGVYVEMRGVGAVCVADEVQCGYGRVGSAFWAFQTQDVAPDIITFGKPMGNGFPCAGVMTTPQLAAAFAAGRMEFFATYGGCTAAAAAALAVLDVLQEEKLLQNATEVGKYAVEELKALQNIHGGIIGDVRGLGLMVGVELVVNPTTKAPAPATAAFVKSYCKKHWSRVLLSVEGPFSNVIKIKPPMCFSHADVDRMVAAIGEAVAAVEELGPDAAAALRRRNEEEAEAVQKRRVALAGTRI